MNGSAPEAGEVIACLLSEREQAIRGEVIAETLFAQVNEVAELADGYGYRFDDVDPWVAAIQEFVAAERRYCPFLAFEIAFAPHGGASLVAAARLATGEGVHRRDVPQPCR